MEAKYNVLHLKFVSEFKCYVEFNISPFYFVFTQVSVSVIFHVSYTSLQH
jgi:hypothetical protein